MVPRCPHSPHCGGCDFQDRPYEEQLAYKRTFCRNCFAAFSPKEIRDIAASSQVWGYRTKMDFCVAPGNGLPLVGLRQAQSSTRVVDVRQCPVFIDGLDAVLGWVRRWMVLHSVSPYDQRARQGTVRYVSLRHARSSDTVMLCLVLGLTREAFDQQRALFDDFGARALEQTRIRSVFVSLNTACSDTALTPHTVHIAGDRHLIEQVDAIEYLIGPSMFFQSSAAGCAELYRIIRRRIPAGAHNILDMYCGSGGIALQLAGQCQRVVGVDTLAANIDHARLTMRHNRIGNAQFFCRDAADFLKEQAGDFPVAVVDPPRAGLGPEALKTLMDAGIRQLIYVSCNPLQLRQELKVLTRAYTLEAIEGVDMFPQTRHLEVVAVLRKE